MRDLFEQSMGPSPLDPGEAVQRAARRPQLKRFYRSVELTETPNGVAVLLDGKPIRTPARNSLAAPARPIAEVIAAEWHAQKDIVDPATMPLTRLANSILDGVSARKRDVADDIAKYFESDLLFYRAGGPEGLVARQAAQWDPVLAWMTETLGARFIIAEGVMHVRQPEPAVAAARGAIPTEPWSVGALHSITTLTGSALLALALARGFRDGDAIWAAAHVDEDWNIEQWGRDEIALARRAARRTEFDAAALVLKAMMQLGPQ
jgi:chaperone required for assembly of F1-ATPase